MQVNESPFYEEHEIYEMFNTSFLPKLQEIANRVIRQNFPDEEIDHTMVKLVCAFPPQGEALTYQALVPPFEFLMQPVTKKAMEEARLAAQEAQEAQEENAKETS